MTWRVISHAAFKVGHGCMLPVEAAHHCRTSRTGEHQQAAQQGWAGLVSSRDFGLNPEPVLVSDVFTLFPHIRLVLSAMCVAGYLCHFHRSHLVFPPIHYVCVSLPEKASGGFANLLWPLNSFDFILKVLFTVMFICTIFLSLLLSWYGFVWPDTCSLPLFRLMIKTLFSCLFCLFFLDCQRLHPPVWCVGWRRWKVPLWACLSKVSARHIKDPT